MKKLTAAVLAILTLFLSAVTAYADIAVDPVPPKNHDFFILLAAVIVIAVALVIFAVIRSRKSRK